MPRDGTPARARLRQAALDLYRQNGYDQTTTAQIAERAGVTERTYFRHFADKREVLFDGEDQLRDILTTAVRAAPADAPPLSVVVQAFQATVPLLVANRPVALQRAEVIGASAALQERALAKSAALITALADALAERGVPAATARLAARVGMASFERANENWTEDPEADLSALIESAADEVLSLR